MTDCSILIGATDENEDGVIVYNGTSVKDSPETNTSSTPTFTGVITDGASEIGGTLEIEKLSYDSMDDYITLSKQLLSMRSNPAMVTTVETIKIKGEGEYTIRKNYHDCVVDGADYEMKPEEKSTHNLKFKYARMNEYVNDTEIKLD